MPDDVGPSHQRARIGFSRQGRIQGCLQSMKPAKVAAARAQSDATYLYSVKSQHVRLAGLSIAPGASSAIVPIDGALGHYFRNSNRLLASCGSRNCS